MNFKFLASQTDLKDFFKFIFEELKLSVFQSYSDFEVPLKEFKNADEVINEIAKQQHSTQLVFWKKIFGFDYVITKVDLNPQYCNGNTFRYRIDGWGLIHFQANKMKDFDKNDCIISHNSEKRALAWELNKPELGKATALNWKEINSTSRKIKYHISKKPNLPLSIG